MDKFERTDWYYWPCQAGDGATHMYIDHYLARQFGKTLDRPILRFFTWDPYCISLGYHQRPSDINQELCLQEGIDLVRRPTGGRAILHAEELTYSVIYPYPEMDVALFYRQIHLPMVQALHQLDIPAKFEPAQADFRNIYKTDRAYLCFATSARHEIEISGKKLVGSAQRVYQNSILQHGSLLLGPAHEKLVDFLEIEESKRRNIRNYVREHTNYLWKFIRGLTAETLANLIREQFTRSLAIHFRPAEENPHLGELLRSHPDPSEFAVIHRESRLAEGSPQEETSAGKIGPLQAGSGFLPE